MAPIYYRIRSKDIDGQEVMQLKVTDLKLTLAATCTYQETTDLAQGLEYMCGMEHSDYFWNNTANTNSRIIIPSKDKELLRKCIYPLFKPSIQECLLLLLRVV